MTIRWLLFLVIGLFGLDNYAQDSPIFFQQKIIYNDYLEIEFDSIAISPFQIKVFKSKGGIFPKNLYSVNTEKATILFKEIGEDTLTISYRYLPSVLTEKSSLYPLNFIVSEKEQKLYELPKDNKTPFIPFDGLNTKGSLSRAISVGNQQNLVTTSNLDLQLTGKISDKVSLKASLKDDSSPLQNGGYSQKINEFNQIFVELAHEDWKVRGGDLFLENKSSFLTFNKKVQGLQATFNFGDTNKSNIEAAAALVRGQYAKSTFTGIEGNQGPYKLKGKNNELYTLVISDSERVYVNGNLLKRGENNDYIIDYNSGEIIFTPKYPISSTMRIIIEYQYTERNYTRFVTYNKNKYQAKNWSFTTQVYSESDSKSRPLQQNLSDEQIKVLQQAGNNSQKMEMTSAVEDSYAENKILYIKKQWNNIDYFEFSTNKNSKLYTVNFSYIGEKKGDYILKETNTIRNIYEFIPPINGQHFGDYQPIQNIVAPIRKTSIAAQMKYQPNEKTSIDAEIAVSNNDKNLFSKIDNELNTGWGIDLNATHQISKKWDIYAKSRLVHKHFESIERIQAIEFLRNWNITDFKENQQQFLAGAEYHPNDKANVKWETKALFFTNRYQGIKNHFITEYKNTNWTHTSNTSWLYANLDTTDTNFYQLKTQTQYQWHKQWAGINTSAEYYKENTKDTVIYNQKNQKFIESKIFYGLGKKENKYAEIGALMRATDSLKINQTKQNSTMYSLFLNSRSINAKNTKLSILSNYKWVKTKKQNQTFFNVKTTYSQFLFDRLIHYNMSFANTTGNTAQQEYTFIEVEPTTGTHTWIDYNQNNIQELEEFELAAYPDQATFVKMLLPTQKYVPTLQNKVLQSLIIDFSLLKNKSNNFNKLLSRFYLQSQLISEQKIKKQPLKNFLIPYVFNDNNLVSQTESLTQQIWLNKSKKHHKINYTFRSNTLKSLQSFGSIEQKTRKHLLRYQTRIIDFINFDFTSYTQSNYSVSEDYVSKNFIIKTKDFKPKCSLILTNKKSLEIYYHLAQKENKHGIEKLHQQEWGVQFSSHNKTGSIQAKCAYYNNQWEGNAYSSAAYSMLEGLQPGKNVVWSFYLKKKLTKYLEANINYQGRNAEESQTIHTGNIQLRAFF